jgi:hypothetical protein
VVVDARSLQQHGSLPQLEGPPPPRSGGQLYVQYPSSQPKS